MTLNDTPPEMLKKIYLERHESNEVRNFPQNQIKVSPMNS